MSDWYQVYVLHARGIGYHLGVRCIRSVAGDERVQVYSREPPESCDDEEPPLNADPR